VSAAESAAIRRTDHSGLGRVQCGADIPDPELWVYREIITLTQGCILPNYAESLPRCMECRRERDIRTCNVHNADPGTVEALHCFGLGLRSFFRVAAGVFHI